MGCILPKTPAALTRPVIGPCAASMSAMPLTTALSLATSDGAGHRIVCAPANVGVATAQISTRAHQHVNDGFELLVAIIDDHAGLTRAPEDADIGGCDIVEMLLVADRCEIFGLVEDAQKFRHLADEIEER